jgi:hypothetical protein
MLKRRRLKQRNKKRLAIEAKRAEKLRAQGAGTKPAA